MAGTEHGKPRGAPPGRSLRAGPAWPCGRVHLPCPCHTHTVSGHPSQFVPELRTHVPTGMPLHGARSHLQVSSPLARRPAEAAASSYPLFAGSGVGLTTDTLAGAQNLGVILDSFFSFTRLAPHSILVNPKSVSVSGPFPSFPPRQPLPGPRPGRELLTHHPLLARRPPTNSSRSILGIASLKGQSNYITFRDKNL